MGMWNSHRLRQAGKYARASYQIELARERRYWQSPEGQQVARLQAARQREMTEARRLRRKALVAKIVRRPELVAGFVPARPDAASAALPPRRDQP